MSSANHSARVLNMTKGNPLSLILQFAIPLFIGNIFQQFYNMVDTMVVGFHLGDQAIAAIGSTSSLYTLVFFFASGLNNGYGIIVTQRFGSRNILQMKQAVAGMILLDLVITLVLSLFGVVLLPYLIHFMNTPEAIYYQAYSYIVIIYAGLVFTISYNMFAAILRAMGNSRSPLYFLILSSLLNIFLDILFVMVLNLGIAGAAAATVLAQMVSALLCGIHLIRNYREFLPGFGDFAVPAETLKDLLAMGFSMALMSCLVEIGSVIFQRSINLLGETIIAAYAASRKLLMLMIQPQATIATANSTFVAQNWGARQYTRIRKTLKQVLALEIVWSLTATIIIYLFGAHLIRLITGTQDPQMIREAVKSLRLHFFAFPFLGVLFCMRNAMQSMGKKLIPTLSSVIELSMKLFSAAVLIPTLGFTGACITEPIAWILMTLFLLISYARQYRTFFSEESPV